MKHAMDNFLLKRIDNSHILLLCLSHNSVMAYINDIMQCEEIKHTAGILVIDQILVVGNGKNRFISCNFSHGSINIAQSKLIPQENSFSFRRFSSELLNSVKDKLT